MPTAPLRKDFFCETVVSGKPVCLGQRNQVLMTVQFPGDLAVAHFSKIQVLDAVKRLAGRELLIDGVEVPIDLFPVVEICVSQQIEAVRTNLVSAFKDFAGLLGYAIAN